MVILFEAILTLEVLPGISDCLHVLQISLLTLEVGLIPCFFPRNKICLAALSEILELFDIPCSKTLESEFMANLAPSFRFILVLRDLLPLGTIVIPQRVSMADLTFCPTFSIDPEPSIDMRSPFSWYHSPSGCVCSW